MHLLMPNITLFPSVIQKEATNALLLGKDIPQELLVGTTQANSSETFACDSVPNIFFIYFGQHLPTGKITSDVTQTTAFQNMGLGYGAWANLVNNYIADEDNIEKNFDLGVAAHTKIRNPIMVSDSHI